MGYVDVNSLDCNRSRVCYYKLCYKCNSEHFENIWWILFSNVFYRNRILVCERFKQKVNSLRCASAYIFFMAYYSLTLCNSHPNCLYICRTNLIRHFYLHVYLGISFIINIIGWYCQYDLQYIDEQILIRKKIQICYWRC